MNVLIYHSAAEHTLASFARGPLECSDGPVVYAAPIEKHKRPFKRPEHIYNDITAPDLPPRGYHQDMDSVGDTSGNPEEALYSVVNVAESEVWWNVCLYMYGVADVQNKTAWSSGISDSFWDFISMA